MTDVAVSIENLSKRFRLYEERNQSLKAALMRGRRASYRDFWALEDVSFDIPAGSTFGLIGENGSGKSTLLKCIAQILRPNKGSVRSFGSIAALLELGSGFHQELSGRENVYLNASILGMKKREIDRKFDGIVEFASIGDFIDQPVKNYSSGMYVRLAFSVAINVDPDILLVDEVLAVGDATFQEKCMEKFADFRRAGKTVIIVSHAMGTMRTLCDEAVWLDKGKLIEVGKAAQLVDTYIDTGHVEHEVVAESGATRWGSGEIRLHGIELLDQSGEKTRTVRTGDSVTLRLHYTAAERIEQPVFGFGMTTLEGVHVWGHHARNGGIVPPYVEGSGSLDLVVPRLMLQPGTFDLLVNVTDWTMTHTFDFLRNSLRFDVDQGVPQESGGIMALGGAWRNFRAEDPQINDIAEPTP